MKVHPDMLSRAKEVFRECGGNISVPYLQRKMKITGEMAKSLIDEL